MVLGSSAVFLFIIVYGKGVGKILSVVMVGVLVPRVHNLSL